MAQEIVIPSFKVLFSESIEQFKLKWRSLLGIQLVGLAMMLGVVVVGALLLGGGILLGNSLGNDILIGVLGVIVVLLLVGSILYLSSWMQIALLLLIGDSQIGSWKMAFKESRYFVLRFLGTMLVFGLLLGLAFILLVVPGIIMAVFWSLVLPVFMLEGLFGWAALKRSKALVSGHWKVVFVRWLLLAAVSVSFGIGFAVLASLFGDNMGIQLILFPIQLVFNFVYGMVMLIFSFILYGHLAKRQPLRV